MALTFSDGGNQVVACGTDASVRNLETLTVAAWVYPTAQTVNRRIVNQGGWPGGWNLNINGAATRWAFWQDYATTDAESWTADNAVHTNTWMFVAATKSGANAAKLYYADLGGVLAEETSYTRQYTPSGSYNNDASGEPLRVGNQVTLDKGFPGRIAWVGIWNRVLSLGELQAQMYGRHPSDGCRFFMELGWNGTGTQPDWSGYRNNGTVSNSPAVSEHVPLAWLPPHLVLAVPYPSVSGAAVDLSGAIAGVSGSAAALSVGRPLVGTVGGASSAGALLSVWRSLTGAIAATASATAALVRSVQMAVGVAGASAVMSIINAWFVLAGDVYGQATATAVLSIAGEALAVSHALSDDEFTEVGTFVTHHHL